MTHAQVHQAFAEGKLTPEEAADAIMAIRAARRPSPLMAAATWGVLVLVVMLALGWMLWDAQSGVR